MLKKSLISECISPKLMQHLENIFKDFGLFYFILF